MDAGTPGGCSNGSETMKSMKSCTWQTARFGDPDADMDGCCTLVYAPSRQVVACRVRHEGFRHEGWPVGGPVPGPPRDHFTVTASPVETTFMVVFVPRNAQRQLPEAAAFTVVRRWPLLSVVAVFTVLYLPPGFLY